MPDNPSIFQVTTPDESPGFSLWQVSSLWQRQINAGLRPFGLTHAQFVLLASLAWFAGDKHPITQVELASHAKMDVMMASNVLRTLEEKGLILRNPHPTDTRAKALTITEQGRTLAAQTVLLIETIDREFFNALGVDVPAFNQHLLRLIAANQG
ncbi:MAG: MarR family transcriptional regulator [Chloroflexi bacterium]|nr:MarR family transcriptional regulator [Chloroflexota bacterium]MBP8058361.1 MarR family transcriptional regulator [Chloroflexota bacterium]